MGNIGVGGRVSVSFEGECVEWSQRADGSEPSVSVVVGCHRVENIPQRCVTALAPTVRAAKWVVELSNRIATVCGCVVGTNLAGLQVWIAGHVAEADGVGALLDERDTALLYKARELAAPFIDGERQDVLDGKHDNHAAVYGALAALRDAAG